MRKLVILFVLFFVTQVAFSQENTQKSKQELQKQEKLEAKKSMSEGFKTLSENTTDEDRKSKFERLSQTVLKKHDKLVKKLKVKGYEGKEAYVIYTNYDRKFSHVVVFDKTNNKIEKYFFYDSNKQIAYVSLKESATGKLYNPHTIDEYAPLLAANYAY